MESGSFQGDDAELRAALVVSSILGLTIARHFLKLRPFEEISQESLVGAAHTWLTGWRTNPPATSA